jgi:hypothetical protein
MHVLAGAPSDHRPQSSDVRAAQANHSAMTEAVRFAIIATSPPSVAPQIEEVRQRACEVGRSFAALAYPPHISLRVGAFVPAPMIERFLDGFETVVGQWDPFPLRTDGLLCTSYRDGETSCRLPNGA